MNTKILITAQIKINAHYLIIKLKDSIILKNIRLNSAFITQKNSINAIMVIIVPLLIHLKIWKLDWFIQWKRIKITIYTTLRQNGVLLSLSITKPNVIMLIIGKTLEENLTYLIMIQQFYVIIGKEILLSWSMKKVAFWKHHVKNVMDGKNKNFILKIIKLNHVKIKNVIRINNAHSTIASMKKEKFLPKTKYKKFLE